MADIEEGIVTAEKKHLPATEEKEEEENDRHSVTLPLLQHKYQGICNENRKADTQTVMDGASRQTSEIGASRELELVGRGEPSCSGSVMSLCSDRSRHECPICSELFDSQGDQHFTILNCDHALCNRCMAGMMRRTKDQSRLQCPFCRQTTPLPQWEIRRLQEESYSSSAHEPGPALVISPSSELQAVPASSLCCFGEDANRITLGCCVYPSCPVRDWRQMQPSSICYSITALLLLLLVLLGCFLYMLVPAVLLSLLFSNS